MAGRPLDARSPEVARILQAIGSNMGQVQRVVIDISVNDVVKVYVTRVMNDEEADTVADMLEGGKFLRIDESTNSREWVTNGAQEEGV